MPRRQIEQLCRLCLFRHFSSGFLYIAVALVSCSLVSCALVGSTIYANCVAIQISCILGCCCDVCVWRLPLGHVFFEVGRMHTLKVDFLFISRCDPVHATDVFDVSIRYNLDVNCEHTLAVKCVESDESVIDLSFLQSIELRNYDPSFRKDSILLSYSTDADKLVGQPVNETFVLSPIDEYGLVRCGVYCFVASKEKHPVVDKLQRILNNTLIQYFRLDEANSVFDSFALQHTVACVSKYFKQLHLDVCVVSFKTTSPVQPLVSLSPPISSNLHSSRGLRAKDWLLLFPDVLCAVDIPLLVSKKSNVLASPRVSTDSPPSDALSHTHDAYSRPSRRLPVSLRRPAASSSVSIASVGHRRNISIRMNEDGNRKHQALSPLLFKFTRPPPSGSKGLVLYSLTQDYASRDRSFRDFRDRDFTGSRGDKNSNGRFSATPASCLPSAMMRMLRGWSVPLEEKSQDICSSVQWIKKKPYTKLRADRPWCVTILPESRGDHTAPLKKWETSFSPKLKRCLVCHYWHSRTLHIYQAAQHDVERLRRIILAKLKSQKDTRQQLLFDLCHVAIGNESLQILLCDLFLFDAEFTNRLLEIGGMHNFWKSRNAILGLLHLCSIKSYSPSSPINPRIESIVFAVISSWETRRILSFFLLQGLPMPSNSTKPSNATNPSNTTNPIHSSNQQKTETRPTTGFQDLLERIFRGFTREAVLALQQIGIQSVSEPRYRSDPLFSSDSVTEDKNTCAASNKGKAFLEKTRKEDRKEILRFLISLFWSVKSEVIRLRQIGPGLEFEAVTTFAKHLLLKMIDEADAVERLDGTNRRRTQETFTKNTETEDERVSGFYSGRISILKVFANQLAFKRHLTSLNDQLSSGASSVSDNADRKTERLRKSIAFGSNAKSCELLKPRPTQLDATSPTNKPAGTPPISTEIDPLVENSTATSRSGFFSLANLFAFSNDEAIRHQAVRLLEEELDTLLRTKCSVGADPSLYPAVCTDKVPSYFPLPTDPDLLFVSLDPGESYVIKSTKYPLVLACNTINSEARFVRKKFLFKSNDDLRQDRFVIEIFRWFQLHIFEPLYGLRTHLSRYQVLPLSCHEGLIEFVEDATPISHLKRQPEISLKSYIQGQSNDLSVERFILSAGSYSTMTYVCSVGDRHQDNLMVDKQGRFFHIDFGYIFGNDPKPFATIPMKITNEMIACLDGIGSDKYSHFIQTCCLIFYVLRKSHSEFANLALLTHQSEIPDVKRLRKLLIQQQKGETQELMGSVGDSNDLSVCTNQYRQFLLQFRAKVLERLRIELDDAESITYLINDVLGSSIRSILPVFADKLHEWAIYWK
eukprot:Gregarina_sp_Poly_1__11325@NODE_949_length_5585_cov_66_135194_g673_i0_p1_GENE_NODE_949_length_5585_cov_66_135194_g673_i0NODE_949_length_5585_cov_66_135194_g673_i0_p1_ORF_typecomplete_len1325_score172_64PI3_PI4_kinase/PF00454_27/1_7e34DUF4135/PF13575_6/0_0026_NODE_949_length_5585_cov_66_135194_g673_i043978